MEHDDGNDILRKALAELARVLAAMIGILTALWFLAGPAVQKFVDDTITARHLAPQYQVDDIRSDVHELQSDRTVMGKQLEHLNAQVDSIERLAQEQRRLSTDILLELKKQ